MKGWPTLCTSGVTEAGEGEDGRIKSAVGIGTLLAEGLGDTIRVSLTEAPEAEIPVARMLAELAEEARQMPPLSAVPGGATGEERYTYQRRATRTVGPVGGGQVPVVCHDLTGRPLTPAGLYGLGHRYQTNLDKWEAEDAACDLHPDWRPDLRFCAARLDPRHSRRRALAGWRSQRPERHHPALGLGRLHRGP